MEKEFHNLIERKFIRIQDSLVEIIDPETFNFIKKDDPNEYKNLSEFDAMFKKENDRILQLDIGMKEKGILRSILKETIQYGISYGTMYELFPDLSEYINSNLAKEQNRKKMHNMK